MRGLTITTPVLLEAWNANMDIQFIENAYGCVMYMTSYVCKTERELGEIVKEAKAQIAAGNRDVKPLLRKLGSVYFKNSDISVWEAAVLVCGLRLKDCSRDVIFAATDEKCPRNEFSIIKDRKLGRN